MSKVALVLSGGGSKGAFQAGAEKYAREVRGLRWSVISGVSIGALNGAFLAMEAYSRLEYLWKTVCREDIFLGRRDVFGYMKLLWSRSVYDTTPLRRMIETEIDVRRMTAPLVVGAVSLRTGKHVTLSPNGKTCFHDALMASMAVPVFFPPVDIEPYGPMVDGGVRSSALIGEALEYGPDEVVVIHTWPARVDRKDDADRNSLSIASRTLEIMMNEIVLNDVRALTRINRLLEQAAEQGADLENDAGRAYRRYRCTVIQPDETLGGKFDFTRRTLDRHWEAGWEAARKALG